MAVRRCGCGKSIPDNPADLEGHKSECPDGGAKLSTAVSRRPDLEFYAPAQQLWIVIDVSLVAVISRGSMKEANTLLDSLLGARNKTKQDLYKLMVASRNAAFLVASATANGSLSNETRMICSIIRDNSQLYHDSYDRICEELIAGVQEASANALMNGERLLLHLPPKSLAHPATLPVPLVEYPAFRELSLTVPQPRPSTRASQGPCAWTCKACGQPRPTNDRRGDWCSPCASSKGLICGSCHSLSNETSQCPGCARWLCPTCIDPLTSFCHHCAPRHSTRLQRDDERTCPIEERSSSQPASPMALQTPDATSGLSLVPSGSLNADAAPWSPANSSAHAVPEFADVSFSPSEANPTRTPSRSPGDSPLCTAPDTEPEEAGRTSTGQPIMPAPQAQHSAARRMLGLVSGGSVGRMLGKMGGMAQSLHGRLFGQSYAPSPLQAAPDAQVDAAPEPAAAERLSSCPLPEHRSKDVHWPEPPLPNPVENNTARRLHFDQSPIPPPQVVGRLSTIPIMGGQLMDQRLTFQPRNPFELAPQPLPNHPTLTLSPCRPQPAQPDTSVASSTARSRTHTPEPPYSHSKFRSQVVQERTTLVFDDAVSGPSRRSGIPLLPPPRSTVPPQLLTTTLQECARRTPRRSQSASTPQRIAPAIVEQSQPDRHPAEAPSPQMPTSTVEGTTLQSCSRRAPATESSYTPWPAPRNSLPSVLCARPPLVPMRRSVSHPPAHRRTGESPPSQSPALRAPSPATPEHGTGDVTVDLSPISPPLAQSNALFPPSNSPAGPATSDGDARLQAIVAQIYATKEDSPSPERITPRKLHALLLQTQDSSSVIETPKHRPAVPPSLHISFNRQSLLSTPKADAPRTPSPPRPARTVSLLDHAGLSGQAEALLHEFANDCFLEVASHLQQLHSLHQVRNDPHVCSLRRDDFARRQALKSTGALDHLPLSALLHSAPKVISAAIDEALARACDQEPVRPQPQLPAELPSSFTARASLSLSADDAHVLLTQYAERCIDLMLEHTFLLAWYQSQPHSGNNEEPYDMTAASTAFLNSKQVTILRSQAIGKPKSGKPKPEPIAVMSKRISVNIDNFAEAAMENLQQRSLKSTRQTHLPQIECCPPEHSPQPKPLPVASIKAAIRPTNDSSETEDDDDDDGDRPPARRPRGPEQPLLPSIYLQMEKENVAPVHQRSSSARTAVESSNAKHTHPASRCPVPPPHQLQRSGECDTLIAPTSPVKEEKKSNVESETGVPAAAPPPSRGLSSKAKNKTRTASCPPAKSKSRNVTRRVGQKQSEREEVDGETETESTTVRKRRERRCRDVTNAEAARLAPATGEGQSQLHADNASRSDAGEPTTARLDGALDVAPATAAGNLFCVPPRSSSDGSVRSTVVGNKLVERALN